MSVWRTRMLTGVSVGLISLTAGCATDHVLLDTAHLPPNHDSATDASTTRALGGVTTTAPSPRKDRSAPFELPAALPGADAPAIEVPPIPPNSTPAEKEATIRKVFPELTAASTPEENDSPGMSLADLQQMALTNSPRVSKSRVEAEAIYGQVIQAGLHPNPTIGYQVDQWQPGLRIPAGNTGSNLGQQGGFINLLIKTAGKLTLAQQVAGYDYVNALVAVRRAEVDVTAQVRTAYFAALVARRSADVNRALAVLADEVYQLQLKRVAAGTAATHEPLPFHAQAVQAQTAVTQAEAAYASAWRQLAAAVGQANLPVGKLAGRPDVPSPSLNIETLKSRMLDQHTELLTARNQMARAKVDVVYQQRQPIPDLQTNTYHQYDNLSQTYQFGVQVGVQLPILDRNQGNIRSAQERVAASIENLRQTEAELQSRLAEAFGRYESAAKAASSYREQVLPDLVRTYRGIVRQYQVEPEKVGFNDIVVAQQSLAQALQSYQTALDAQWRALVDLAVLAQLDDLFVMPTVEKPNPKPPTELKP